MRVDRNDTAAVIIDVQERLYPVVKNKDKLANNLAILIQGLKHLDIPILVTQQYTKGLGETIEPIKQILGTYSPIEKISFSCCDEPGFISELSTLEKKFVIVAGIEAHICVLQTVIDLIKKGYTPVVVKDCISSRKKVDKKTAIERMRSEGAVITTCESILFELCRYAGTNTFKAISNLVK